MLDLAGGRTTRCNCSICTKLGVTGQLVKPAALTVLAGEDQLASYSFRDPNAQRCFCKRCGTHVFGRGDLEVLGGPFVSININTLDGIEPNDLHVVYWDGRHDNWMAGPRDTPWPTLRAGH